MMESIGQQAVVNILSHIIFIIFTWRVFQAVNFEPMFRKGRTAEATVVIIFLTIAVGTTVSNFFLNLLQWSGQLLYLF
ncbi:DUF1146 family protein [Radiobacillus kanasensis]|uniref:DUF1146 family protein n=1 Tax=Radiobacillus kanasensis TaxID=2844358 RepID=UPI001E2F0E79|nr:DUF1146 family protein [Radiobacillus kanasensis]UFT98935.1 DUF1146 family protein [Radiobacillus kanasensis]